MSGHTCNPPDDELITRYLNKKITETGDLGEVNEVNICHHEPEDIPGLARMESSHTWHVISRVEKLNGRCGRTKRSSKTGHWKVTGRTCSVKDNGGNIIGFKKFLVFQENKRYSSSSSSSQQYKWKVHEFHSSIQHPNKDAFVLRKLMKKTITPRSDDAVADTSPVAIDLPPIPTSNPIVGNFESHFSTREKPIKSLANEDFKRSSDFLDQCQYYDFKVGF